MAILIGILLLGVGLLACFFGKKLYRVLLALAGFIIGYYLASGLLAGQSEVITILVSVVVGGIGAFIFWSLYKFVYVVFGLSLGLALGALISVAFNLGNLPALVVVVVLGLAGAVLGNMVGDLMIRLSTAFSGAAQAVGGVAALTAAIGLSLPLADPTHGAIDPNSTAGVITIVLVAILGAIGYYFQTQNDTTSAI